MRSLLSRFSDWVVVHPVWWGVASGVVLVLLGAFYIFPAGAKKSLFNLFATHPPVEERIKRLRDWYRRGTYQRQVYDRHLGPDWPSRCGAPGFWEAIEAVDDGELGWDAFNATLWRITRRIVLGDGARDDTELTDMLWELMEEANGLPDEPSGKLGPYLERIAGYV